MIALRAYLYDFNGAGQDASSRPSGLGAEEEILPPRKLLESDVVHEYHTTSSSVDIVKMMRVAMEPQTSTPARREYVSSDPYPSTSQESDMDDMEKEWVNARLEAAQERANAQMTSMQAQIDIGIARIESQVGIIIDNVRQLSEVVRGIHGDGRETRSEINRLVNRVDEAEKDTRKELHEIKSYQTGMRLWYIGTTIVLFLAILTIVTFGKDMFEWGRSLPQ